MRYEILYCACAFRLVLLVLLYVHVEIIGDIESVPLVIDHDDLSCGSLSLVPHLPAQVTVDSPLQVERVLPFDDRLVYIIICNPLSVDLNLGSGNLENYAFVIPLIQRNRLCRVNQSWQTCWHAVLKEESCRVHQN